MTTAQIWMLIGFLGQAFFSSRFLVQWIYSERHQKSIVPNSFWILSMLGGSILLFYAIHRKDPVFIAGQAVGMFVYARNLWFIHQGKKAGSE